MLCATNNKISKNITQNNWWQNYK